jgi:hypothetical protein
VVLRPRQLFECALASKRTENHRASAQIGNTEDNRVIRSGRQQLRPPLDGSTVVDRIPELLLDNIGTRLGYSDKSSGPDGIGKIFPRRPRQRRKSDTTVVIRDNAAQ